MPLVCACEHLGACILSWIFESLCLHRKNSSLTKWIWLIWWVFKKTFSLCDVIVWLAMNEESSPPQLTTAAQWVQRPLPTAPLQLTTTMDTWVWANRDSHVLFSLFLVFWPTLMSLCRAAYTWILSSSTPSLVFCVSLFIRTGAFQTSTNPQSPSLPSHPHRWHATI